MNEELCHRNMAFTLYQADEMPMIKMGDATAEKVGGDVYRVFVDISNPEGHADDPGPRPPRTTSSGPTC